MTLRINSWFNSALLSVFAATIAVGQVPPASKVRIAVTQTVSATDELAAALVLQRADASQPDVVVIKEASLTAQTLGGALGLLRTLNSKGRPSKDRYIYVKGSIGNRMPEKNQQKLNGIIHQLNSAPNSQIGNLGAGRWIERASALIR
jgi:hypothetical protein